MSEKNENGQEKQTKSKTDSEKHRKYLNDLLKINEMIEEKKILDPKEFRFTVNLLENEIERMQKNVIECNLIDLYNCVPIRIIAKVEIPKKEFRDYNFVGKILGPKGLTMKKIVDDTQCRIAVLGRGSMRNSEEEERLRLSDDLRYKHLSEDLHVEIQTIAEAPEAFARISLAMSILKILYVPDKVSA